MRLASEPAPDTAAVEWVGDHPLFWGPARYPTHIGGKYGIRSVLSGLRILEECVSPDAMLGFEG